MGLHQHSPDGSPYLQEDTAIIESIPENENEELVVEPDDSDIFFGIEAPRSPQGHEEKLVEKVSFVKEILQAELALWTVVYSFLLTKVWCENRPTYRIFNICVVTPFILWITVLLSVMVPTIVVSIRICWSIQKRLFRLFQAPSPSPPTSGVVTRTTSRKNSTASGAVGRTDFSYSYHSGQITPLGHRSRVSSLSGSYHRPCQKRRLSFHD
uniref:Uncharacterized protein n=1 Tax=Plectus sambesii TaxID=2011161 RepID=A0A914WV06_9BILA